MSARTQSTVYLFDIDGTLLHARGSGRAAFDAALLRVYGAPGACASIAFGGMTDRAIARLALRAIDVEPTEARIDEVLAVYLEELAHALRSVGDFTVLPRARELPTALAAAGHAAVGLGTGNVRAGAEAKLARAGLDGVFAFGGFGCDHEERSEVLRAGARRGAERLRVAPEACRVVVIGDTVRDVDAAKRVGALCVAVCTGGAPRPVLERAGADAVFDDLASDGVEALLRSYAGG